MFVRMYHKPLKPIKTDFFFFKTNKIQHTIVLLGSVSYKPSCLHIVWGLHVVLSCTRSFNRHHTVQSTIKYTIMNQHSDKFAYPVCVWLGLRAFRHTRCRTWLSSPQHYGHNDTSSSHFSKLCTQIKNTSNALTCWTQHPSL